MSALDLKSLHAFTVFVFAVSYFFNPSAGRSTSTFPNYYEVVNYKILTFQDKEFPPPLITRPSILGLHFNFKAFQRNFSVIVWLNSHIFQTNVKTTLHSKYKEQKKWMKEGNMIYEGELKDEPGSRVSGYIINGSFSGLISTKYGKTFYLEPLQSHSDDLQEKRSPFTQAIIYKDSDIVRNTSYTFEVQPLKAKPRPPKDDNKRGRLVKRLAKQHNSCPVLLAADSSFFKNVGHESQIQTMAEMSYHLSEASRLFRQTRFFPENNESIGLVIAAMTIFKDRVSEGILASPDDVSVEKYLRKWSSINHDSYCLSLLFTYRDFPSGVLGLAWLAEQHTLGGICESWSSYYEYSFNTAVVTFLNNGRRIPKKVATLTTAHELAHGFGAKHDPVECQPNGEEGNYIMYQHATDTSHPNNDRFSECSINDMRPILESKAHYCFTGGTSFCGNKFIEDGEECDCGNVDECEKHDPCCTAKDEKAGVAGCLLRPTVQCSPKAGPCCTNNCQFINASTQRVCKQETQCSFESFCENGSCPIAQPKPDNTICNNGSNVCKNGQCTGSICALFGHTECSCLNPYYPCYVCCKNSKGDCVSTAEFAGRIIAQPSTKLCEVNRYCDGAGRCVRHVDTHNKYYQGPFQDLWGWIKKRWYIFMFTGLGLLAQISYSGYGKYRQCMEPDQEELSGELEMMEMGHDDRSEITV